MKKLIHQVADIQTGYQFRGKVSASEDANVCVIQIKDVSDGFIRTDDLTPVKVENPEPYLVFKDDILFLSRGHRQYATLVTVPVHNTIATGYFFVVRAKANFLLPEFLAWTINQASFQEAIRPFVRGSHIPLISKADFQDISIEVPSLAVQERIMALQELFDHEKHLSASIQEKRQQLLKAVSHKLITGQLTVQGS